MTSEETKEYRKRYYQLHKEEVSASNKLYYQLHKEKIKAQHKAYRSAHGEKWKAYNEKWYSIHKEEIKKRGYNQKEEYKPHHRVRVKANNAIRSGKLIKQPCEVCGCLKVEAHHCDYNKPLDVMWLCKKHHVEWHKSNTPIY